MRLLALAAVLVVLAAAGCGGRSDFGTDATVDDVEEALVAQGLEVCDVEDVDSSLPDADGERVLEVAIDCQDDDEADAVVVVTRFADQEDRDAAAQRFEVQARRAAHGAVWTLGPLLVLVSGDRDPEAVDRVTDAMDELEGR